MTNATEQEYRRWTTAELSDMPWDAVFHSANGDVIRTNPVFLADWIIDGKPSVRLTSAQLSRRKLRRPTMTNATDYTALAEAVRGAIEYEPACPYCAGTLKRTYRRGTSSAEGHYAECGHKPEDGHDKPRKRKPGTPLERALLTYARGLLARYDAAEANPDAHGRLIYEAGTLDALRTEMAELAALLEVGK